MAEGFFNRLASERGLDARAESAGTLGGGEINPVVAEAMAEVGVPLEGHFPKPLTQEMVDRADLVVSMGCGVDAEACPAKFLVTEDWGLDDPKGRDSATVGAIRDAIRERVAGLIERLERG